MRDVRPMLRVVLALIGAGLLLAGCEKPLLSSEDERSPFDRYDSVRNQYAQQRTMDAFGRSKPNLRERLLPKD